MIYLSGCYLHLVHIIAAHKGARCLVGVEYNVGLLALVHFCSKQNLLTRCHHSDTTQPAASSVNRANLLGVKNSCISDQGPCTLWLC